jgi:hypothetical protein
VLVDHAFNALVSADIEARQPAAACALQTNNPAADILGLLAPVSLWALCVQPRLPSCCWSRVLGLTAGFVISWLNVPSMLLASADVEALRSCRLDQGYKARGVCGVHSSTIQVVPLASHVTRAPACCFLILGVRVAG